MFGLNLPRICKAHWPTIALSALTCVSAALFVADRLPKSYEGIARVRADYLSPDPVTRRFQPRTVVSRFADTQNEIISDSIITDPVAQRLGYVMAPPGGDTQNPQYLSSLRRGSQTVADQTIVQWDREVPEFDIRFYAGTPQAAAKGAETVRQVYLDRLLEMKHRSDRDELETLQRAGARLTSALDDATKRKREFEKKHGVHLFDDNTNSLELGMRALTGSVRMPRGAKNPERRRSPVNMGQLARVNSALALATQQLGPNHPQVIALVAQRNALAARAAQASANDGQVREAPGSATAFSAQTARILAQRNALDGASRIASEISVLAQHGRIITARAADIQQELASDYTGLEAVGPVELPTAPISPRMKIIAVLALAIGLVLGVQISVLIELLNRRVRGTDDLSDLDVPVLVAYNRQRVLEVDEPEAEAA